METPQPSTTDPAGNPQPQYAPECPEVLPGQDVSSAPDEADTAVPMEQRPTDAPAPDDDRPSDEAGSASLAPATFDEALERVISAAGGEILFRLTADEAYGDTVAAVRLGIGDDRLIALVILPPDGEPLRVEPVDDSSHSFAALAKSYASLVDAWKPAA